jgi:hypothetical protein
MGIRYDDASWPIILVQFEGQVTDHEFADYLERLTTVFRRRERFTVILDASRAQLTPFSHRHMQANWLRTYKTAIAELNAGTAFVFTSAMFRVVLSGVFMLQPLPSPHTICATLADAVQWSADQLGIDAPARLLAKDPAEPVRTG